MASRTILNLTPLKMKLISSQSQKAIRPQPEGRIGGSGAGPTGQVKACIVKEGKIEWQYKEPPWNLDRGLNQSVRDRLVLLPYH
jgi:hypothetical protein